MSCWRVSTGMVMATHSWMWKCWHCPVFVFNIFGQFSGSQLKACLSNTCQLQLTALTCCASCDSWRGDQQPERPSATALQPGLWHTQFWPAGGHFLLGSLGWLPAHPASAQTQTQNTQTLVLFFIGFLYKGTTKNFQNFYFYTSTYIICILLPFSFPLGVDAVSSTTFSVTPTNCISSFKTSRISSMSFYLLLPDSSVSNIVRSILIFVFKPSQSSLLCFLQDVKPLSLKTQKFLQVLWSICVYFNTMPRKKEISSYLLLSINKRVHINCKMFNSCTADSTGLS